MSFVKRGGGENESTFRPQLTSLVDVMTILLVFLIKSFSVEGNLVTQAEDLVLPVSSSQKPPHPRSSVEITRKAVICEGHEIITLQKLLQSDSLLVSPLLVWMQAQRGNMRDSAIIPEVLIQCDRDIEYEVVKKVMYTCSKAGFSDFSVLVIQEE